MIAVRSLFTAAQNNCVASLQRQHRRIDGHVGPRLVNNSHHSERHAQLADAQSIRPSPLRQGFADWIGKGCDLAHSARHVPDSLRGQQQAVAHGAFEAGAFQIFLVRRENTFCVGFNRIRHRPQHRILLLRRKQREFGGRGGAISFSRVERALATVAGISFSPDVPEHDAKHHSEHDAAASVEESKFQSFAPCPM